MSTMERHVTAWPAVSRAHSMPIRAMFVEDVLDDLTRDAIRFSATPKQHALATGKSQSRVRHYQNDVPEDSEVRTVLGWPFRLGQFDSARGFEIVERFAVAVQMGALDGLDDSALSRSFLDAVEREHDMEALENKAKQSRDLQRIVRECPAEIHEERTAIAAAALLMSRNVNPWEAA